MVICINGIEKGSRVELFVMWMLWSTFGEIKKNDTPLRSRNHGFVEVVVEVHQ